MISRYNWALIENGATFQALVNVLLLHEDPGTIVFTNAVCCSSAAGPAAAAGTARPKVRPAIARSLDTTGLCAEAEPAQSPGTGGPEQGIWTTSRW